MPVARKVPSAHPAPRGESEKCETRRSRLAAWPAAIIAAALVCAPACATVRYKTTGEGTLGGADALAGVKEACEADPDRVWVSVEERGDCIKFYPTGGLGKSRQAVLYFEGDIPASYRHQLEKLTSYLDNLRRVLGVLAQSYRVPYVLVARPGTFGSTGDHGERRKEREYRVMLAAVEALKARFRLDAVSLAGQSGGATIVGALLTLGLDGVKCAVPASGGFDLNRMLDFHAHRLGITGRHREFPASLADSFNVMDHVRDVKPDARRRVFIVGDSGDQITPFDQQKRFAEALRTAGHSSRVIAATGSGSEHHGLAATALKVAGLCTAGASDAAIEAAAQK
ncbi:MAG: prolyl oligopeptidase family serine peptidase [Proteobacteria bacterium]|nr:prolyl oligopeptidase family serine peptidase [Pseudomonadota bacterium]